ncbi:ankyrin repeat and MYND domain-containing protein 1-like [Triplophysa dalaica]|uniref:ankyrin repeat and MYND domain-containing protein 1-like n=1 Tax=Triplophysa dalaica TaxID=1582913 RepID=UPI0024DF358A|nr:ankyrin repeat and MYND domain-containing protein 1-like [Triplophysa dalaica]
MSLWEMDSFYKRNGYGIQEWSEGSKYEGEFKNNLKHGTGVYTWPNGEFFKGSFFRDCRHGNGMYSWPDGSKFTGKFYLNHKEGYGVHVFPDGWTFQGLYHADERFGPGIMTYPDGRQDVGLWHRQRLVRLCTSLEGGFTLRDFPEHMARLPKKQLPIPPQLLTMDDDTGSALDHAPSEEEERFIRPPDIEQYTTDSDHLPVPRGLRRDLDLHFFGRSDISTWQNIDDMPLQQRMNRHIQRHRFEIDALDWDVAAVLNMNRGQFGPKGPLELNSERLIKEASVGEKNNVSKMLRNGDIHPDVTDARGHTALIAATANCHDDIIHFLLDRGVDVDKLNDEGMSALAVCNVLYYPHQSLHETLAEKTPQNLCADLQSLKISEEPEADHPPGREQDTPTLEPNAQMMCQIGTVTPADSQETVSKTAHLKTEEQKQWVTMKLLLDRGADPNASSIPMPAIFLAVKAAHVEGVRRLVLCGARTDIPLPPEQKGLYPLHIAAGLPGAEAPQITELLLHALADPDVKAQDADEVYELDEPQNMSEPQTFDTMHFTASGSLATFNRPMAEPTEEGGRTPLHVACQRDSEYTIARDVVALLLSHKAATNHLWSGHSPLSLAIASGNNLALDELLAAGADPNLPLAGRLGSALCTLANISYDRGPEARNQINLLEKLIKAGADILMPVVVGKGHRCSLGTVVDYAHHAFKQDKRVSQTPYHALNKRERKAYNARCQLLNLMGDLLRQAAIRMERRRVEEEESQGILSVSPTDKFVYTGAGGSRSLLSSPEKNIRSVSKEQTQRALRKPLFKYCYQCGRSVGVVLSACSRCQEVFYCSKSCKMKAWDKIHKDECIRVPVTSGKSNRSKCISSERRPPLSAKDAKAKTFHPNVTPEIQDCDPKENYSFI